MGASADKSHRKPPCPSNDSSRKPRVPSHPRRVIGNDTEELRGRPGCDAAGRRREQAVRARSTRGQYRRPGGCDPYRVGGFQAGGPPENGVEPERAPRPPLDAPIRHKHDQGPEKAESGRGETVRTIQGGVPTRRNDRDHDTKDEDGQANDREADPAYLHRQLHREHDVTLHRARELTARVMLTRNLLSHVFGNIQMNARTSRFT